jgi:hypothetical protein
MNNQFDELTKSMAQSVTRRGALRKFGVGLVAAIAASLGIRSASAAPKKRGYCVVETNLETAWYSGQCVDPITCQSGPSRHCAGLVQGGFDNFICGFYGVDRSRNCLF